MTGAYPGYDRGMHPRDVAGALLVVAGVLLTQRQARDEEVVLSAA
jgi:hypothetical protein